MKWIWLLICLAANIKMAKEMELTLAAFLPITFTVLAQCWIYDCLATRK